MQKNKKKTKKQFGAQCLPCAHFTPMCVRAYKDQFLIMYLHIVDGEIPQR